MTPRRIERTPQARADLIAIHDYIDNDNPAAADRFLDAAETCFQLLSDMPEAGRVWNSNKHPNVRSAIILDFPSYRVFYQPAPRGIVIVTVLHGARDLPQAFDNLFVDG